MPDPISWPELIVLLAFGAGQDLDRETVRGRIHVRDVRPLHDGAELDADDVTETHPTLGTVLVDESELRVSRRGELVRVEKLDGGVTMIFGRDTLWFFGDADVPGAMDRHRTSTGWPGSQVVNREAPSRWEGDDFTRPTGPIGATTFLGRAAWAVELAPPERKPHPVQMIVDAGTGLVLSQANRDFGSVCEWTSVEFDVELPDVLFTYDGPTRDPHADWEAEHEADMAQRQRWLAERGVAGLVVPLVPEFTLHDHDEDTGYFHASFDHGSGSLLRRSRGATPWDEVDQMNWPHTHRWSDDRWDWCLATEWPIDPAGLPLLAARLASTT